MKLMISWRFPGLWLYLSKLVLILTYFKYMSKMYAYVLIKHFRSFKEM